VNTGEALVRLDVDPRSGVGFATGDAMNTTARLEAAAPEMGVAVGQATHAATVHAIAYEELPPVSAKGKAEPLQAWRAMEPISRVVDERDRTPFVGRELELGVLTQLFERSRTRPATEFATIVADPGLGKSRLVRELALHVESVPELIRWRVGRCLPYGEGIGFWALGEVTKAEAGILETDDQATIRDKLEAAVTEPDPQTKAWIVDRLAPLVGLETTTAAPEQQEAFTAWRRFLESLASQGPTVLVIEDLHWADPGFVEFLEHLAERTAGLPLLVVVTARPEVEERHPTWPPGRRSSVLSLSPLTDADLEALVRDALPEASDELTTLVLERAGGSPLYAEQLAAMLHESALPIAGGAIDEALIPASVQALIAARIDALGPGHKRVLMEAAVVGKTFWAGAIASLGEHERLEDTLAELVRREFCRPSTPSTIEGDAEFSFWHALVRDVAYAELTKAERARLHAGVAGWIADRTGEAMGEEAEIVVHHLDAALELAPSAPEFDPGPLTELLATALLAAGGAAMRTDISRAIPYLERAIDVLSEEDPRRLGALRTACRLQSSSGLADLGELRERLEAEIDRYHRRGDQRAVAVLAEPLASVLAGTGQDERAIALLSRARSVLAATPGPELVSIVVAQASWALGDNHLERAEALAEEAIALAADLNLPVPIRAKRVRGAIRFILDEPEGESDLREVVASAEAAGDLLAASAALYSLGFHQSDNVASLAAFDEAVAFDEEHGLSSIPSRIGRSGTLLATGRWDEVLAEAEPLRTMAADQGDTGSTWIIDYQTSWIRLERGERLGFLDGFVQGAIDHGYPIVYVAPLAAEAARAEGEVAQARRWLDEALNATGAGEIDAIAYFVLACLRSGTPDVARRALELGVVPDAMNDAESLLARGLLAEADGEIVAARGFFEQAEEALGRISFLPNRAYALTGLGRCLLVSGETGPAKQRLEEARRLWASINAPPRISEIDRLLATAD
jgi:tetratricopeptide (TPR) repeat protein